MADMMCFFWYSQFNEILDCDAAMNKLNPEEKQKMKPEIKEKADEFLKSGEQRELNLEELELVSGGTEPTIIVNGRPMTKTQFNNFVFAMFDEVGHDAAFNLFTLYTGYDGTYSGGRTELETLLAKYWAAVESGQ